MLKSEIKNLEPDYIHSSNTVFTFMTKEDYLQRALLNKCVFPRYYEENIEYLDLQNDGNRIKTISVLQKCFCDIPLHCITEYFPLRVIEGDNAVSDEIHRKIDKGNTHTDFYGEYGIAFSKSWAQEKNLQPVQYINPKSAFAKQFKSNFEFVLAQDDIDDLIVSDIIFRLAFFKPLFGEMKRRVDGKKISVFKNFYDECEWRFVPRNEELEKYQMNPVIFDEETRELANQISDRLADEKYKELRLNFEFNDIRYLIVPNNSARKKMINYIMALNMGTTDEEQDKYLLISKILVLEDIRKDF